MAIVGLVLGAAAILVCGGLFYSRLVGSLLGEDPTRPTPAVALNDGVDYVPTKTPVVFAHHFASIAGAGPIVGPILALVYGWGPAVCWLIVGGLLAGGVHDYVSMYVSMRERGKSIAVIAREAMGQTAYLCFVMLLVVLLVLVCAQFLVITATALTSEYPPAMLGLEGEQSLFRINPVTGNAVIGGIASTSVVIITLFAPLLGWLYIKRNTAVWICSILAMGVCALSIVGGFIQPVSFNPGVWMVLVSLYCVAAAGFPVWMFLQSRDFVNVHLLYFGLVMLFIALIAAGLQGAPTTLQMTDFAGGYETTQAPIWPFLFITVSCGALSGFHSLCATGTTPKQLCSERSARTVGYWGMLLETFFAICVVVACLVAFNQADYRSIVYPVGKAGNPVLAFAIAVGKTFHLAFDPLAQRLGFSFPVALGTVFGMLLLEGFVVTTLDTAVRLTRYLLEELWATLFRRYDVFAEAEALETQAVAGTACCGLETPDLPAGDLSPAGSAGLDVHPAVPAHKHVRHIVPTAGALRLCLQILRTYWFNSSAVVLMVLVLAWAPASKSLWSIFGSGNQLLAAISLLTLTTWLARAGRPVWFTAVPCVFMCATTLTMLVRLLVLDYLPHFWEKWPLLVFDILILSLTAVILTNGLRALFACFRPASTPSAVAASR